MPCEKTRTAFRPVAVAAMEARSSGWYVQHRFDYVDRTYLAILDQNVDELNYAYPVNADTHYM